MSEAFFYFPTLAQAGDRITLGGDEAHHAASVRRLRAGDALTLFDGLGLTAQTRIESIQPRGAGIEVEIAAREQYPAPRPAIHLCSALPKGDRLATLLEMGTQLGMTSFTPLACAHGVVKPTEANSARMQRIILEACKQSRRPWLPQLRAPVSPSQAASQPDATSVWFAHPGGNALSHVTRSTQETITVLVGPEGGFSEEEVTGMQAAGARSLGLGSGILRIETAGVALLAALRLGGQ